MVSGVTEVVVLLLFHWERFQKILLSDYSPVGSAFLLSYCVLPALLTNVSTELLWVDWESGCCSTWHRVWCNHFSQYSWCKGDSGQFVTEAEADMNSHLKGRDKAELRITWCIIDLSFKSYFCLNSFCMTEFESQNIIMNCNAQWTSSDIKKIYRWSTTKEVVKCLLNIFVLNKWRYHYLCATSTAGTVLRQIQVPLTSWRPHSSFWVCSSSVDLKS